MPCTVFVTGAAGFIGSHVSEAFLARGDRVFGFDNFDPFYDRRIKERNLAPLSAHPAFSFLEGDIRDATALARWGRGFLPTPWSTWPRRPECARRSPIPSATRT